ncbi:single-stranded-DNA-specific exonuclease RecJ [Leptolyngbya sp. NIES-2104]|uniref:single-stranded-DNA-specific exonuclease RecJ n=1 Tax=Leptolyngbya sp. NIES-2104 TaxID=1552121 RepID=UPI0006EC6BFF|nr:single-stranded-DNA-specific exonuclease RecJ [Leptolyngbya sp. NIES-2104]GAP95886.1 single-stranded-DNA-specific exonuclease RecJ [Leptolyngbya sp. NIES-2104]
MSDRSSIPDQRWSIHPQEPDRAVGLAIESHRSPLLTQILINRGFDTLESIQEFLDPERQSLPSPIEDFPDLAISLELLINAINDKTRIAICGDYDADGMTSTALLLRALRYLGARVDYAIPSRMSEGYGINRRIVEEFHDEGVGLILTVDNGIAAHDPIARARELGLTIIVTDHHDLPPTLPNANAILNPKLIDESSPYRGMAGVGVAYVLAVCLAQSFGQTRDLQQSLLELFTLGTIADLAPLTGVNRRWVKRGLHLLPKSKMAGIQALIQIAGLSNEKNLKPEAIGFRLGPRINAIGRLGDPQVVIELFVTDDDGVALECAMKCEQVNKQRQQLCEQIEKEAIEAYENGSLDAKGDRLLLLVQKGWHHGVIGIVASRLVERYGVPVFIGTYEDDHHIRGSARSIPEFNVFEALEFCKDLMLKCGGHKAAGGFSFEADRLDEIRSRLRTFAHRSLKPEHLKPLVTIDAQADLSQLDLALHAQLDALHPCGMDNPDPVFWTPNVLLDEQRRIGKGHLKLVLRSGNQKINAIAWRWGEYFPLPSPLDVAYRLKSNEWNNEVSVQLEIIGVRRPQSHQTEFTFSDRPYTCLLLEKRGIQELRIQNTKGETLIIQKGQKIGTLGKLNQVMQEVDVSQSPFYDLVKAAVNALQV